MEELAQGAHFTGRFGGEFFLGHGGEDARGEGSERVMLVGETGQGESCFLRGAGYGGEVDMRGQVLVPGVGERIFHALVIAVGGE